MIRSKWRGDDSNGISSFPLFFSSAFLLPAFLLLILCFSLLFSALLRFSLSPKIVVFFVSAFFCVRSGRNYLMSLSYVVVLVLAVILGVFFFGDLTAFYFCVFLRSLGKKLSHVVV